MPYDTILPLQNTSVIRLHSTRELLDAGKLLGAGHGRALDPQVDVLRTGSLISTVFLTHNSDGLQPNSHGNLKSDGLQPN